MVVTLPDTLGVWTEKESQISFVTLGSGLTQSKQIYTSKTLNICYRHWEFFQRLWGFPKLQSVIWTLFYGF